MPCYPAVGAGGARTGGARTATKPRAAGTPGGALEKAKAPAAAVGAALIGAAGVAAARSSGKRRSGVLPGGRSPKLSLPRSKAGLRKAFGRSNMSVPDLKKALKGVNLPKPDGSMIDWVEEKAKGVGDAGYRVAEMTSQARRVQKAVSGDSK